jgi:hypothetical protein
MVVMMIKLSPAAPDARAGFESDTPSQARAPGQPGLMTARARKILAGLKSDISNSTWQARALAAGARRRARRPRQLQPWPGRQAATVTALRLLPGRGPGAAGPRRPPGGRRAGGGHHDHQSAASVSAAAAHWQSLSLALVWQ